MIRSFLKITGDFVKPGGMGKRRWEKIMSNAHADMGDYWHKHFLPKHFQPGARSKYAYEPRSKDYLQRKAYLASQGRTFKGRGPIQQGGKVDLVFTGEMAKQLISRNTIRAYPTRATVVMMGPNYLTTRFHKKRQPNKAVEVTKVTNDEAEKLAEVMGRSVQKGINQSSRG